MQLATSTWPEVEAYLKHSTGLIVPIGSTEQHGPIGPIGTDFICAEVLAHGVGDSTGALVAPTISYGMAVHHMNFPGTIALRPSTLQAIVRDVARSAHSHGFRRVLFVNGHGGNTASVQAAFYELYAELAASSDQHSAELRLSLANWWELQSVVDYVEKTFGNAEGSHASPSELGLAWYAHPEAVRSGVMHPQIAPGGSFFDAQDLRTRFADGRIGSDSSLASVELGQELHEIAVKSLAEKYLSFVQAQ